MKNTIAYVMSRYPRITETFVHFEMLEMQRRGRRVLIFPLLLERSQVEHPQVEDMMASVVFEPFMSWAVLRDNVLSFVSSPRAYCAAIRDILSGTLGSFNFFFGALGVFPKSVSYARQAKARGVEHVHAHFVTHPVICALVIKRLAGIPFSFTAHAHDILIDTRMFDIKLREAEFAIMISQYNKSLMIKTFGLPPDQAEKMHIVHCGIDPDDFPAVPAPDNPIPEIACVASFKDMKGHVHLVEALRLLCGQGRTFLCRFIGIGPLEGEIRRRVEEAGLNDVVIFEGALSRPEVKKRLAHCDCVVLPSVVGRRGDHEGIPVALMEAMATQRPVVASRLAGIPELIEDGVSGLLVPPGDVRALAEALAKLLDDPALRRILGERGRETVVQHFNLKIETVKLDALFRRVS
ncbi:glycosyltransferase family 4 protein [Desulfovibrio inopinatus]|uniref:glycosyltransferase family 4 protein n=1 Tax=Desulfovibrio inopinatus TaxID=102109 RepID=UPI000407630F|nr:glycosyltransferase family 4 protein [Desulfovibrio inopinatus]